ncbi:MAG: ribonuclease HII [Hyphomicrobiales bacterium]|nr:MAG: ribonuclease HII [Hyphomicrobiales bacterium]
MARKTSESPTLRLDLPPLVANDELERRAAKRFPGLVAGADEAGRGPLAGPVVAAAVAFEPSRHPQGLADSKKLTAARREALFDEICLSGFVAVTVASVNRIDATDIRKASLWAMAQSLSALPRAPSFALIDGRDVPDECPCPAEAVIKGDARSISIAAASIVAKVTRDRLMVKMAKAYPGYGFERHKGYGTSEHMEALDRLGPCPLHRTTFKPIAELLAR